MIRVLVITNNLRQASFRLRIEALIKPLSERGVQLHIEIRPRSWLARRKLLKSAGDFQAVLLQRKMLDPAEMLLLRRKARKLFFDLDDAVMFHSRPVSAWEQWRTHRRFVGTAKSVDRVVAGNEYLADLFRKNGAAADVLPTVVDPSHYQMSHHVPVDTATLGWIGSASTLPYLQQILPMLAEAAHTSRGLRLMTIADQSLEYSPIPYEHVAWSEETESAALARCDIGIAPMPSDRWTLGKCGFKIVQYMAAGLPVIASPVGANRELVVAGQTGFLPENSADWIDAIHRLSSDQALRSELGRAGRQRVVEHYSIQRAVDFWAKLLGGVQTTSL